MKKAYQKWWFYMIIIIFIIIITTIILNLNRTANINNNTNNIVLESNQQSLKRTVKEYSTLFINILNSYKNNKITFNDFETDLKNTYALYKSDYSKSSDEKARYLSYYIENIIYNIDNNININIDLYINNITNLEL